MKNTNSKVEIKRKSWKDRFASDKGSASQNSLRRLIYCFCVFCLCCSMLFFKLGGLATNTQLQATAATQSRYTIPFNQTRGQIYDCKLNPLTETETAQYAACLPLPENMAKLLEEPALSRNENLSELIAGGLPFVTQARGELSEITGVLPITVPIRNSSQNIARHIIGYVNSDGKGVSGIEAAFDEQLSKGSQRSTISYTVDGLRQPFPGVTPDISYAPILPNGVVLTIDSRIQQLCEEIGSKYIKKGAIVIMEPSTGKIRGAASFPSYSPDELDKAIADTENAPLVNRTFSAFSVGSTFKIVTAATALSQGISEARSYECKGYIDVSGQIFRCHNRAGHGAVDMREAMALSCNPYFIDLGLELDKNRLLAMSRDLSFGKPTVFAQGLSTAAGRVPDISELYSPAAVGNFSFGQGVLLATPIQVAQMICSVVNGGDTPQAALIEGFTDSGSIIETPFELSLPVKAMSPQIAERLKKQLVYSVMETENQKAKPEYVTAGGKTGTAQTGQFKETEEGKTEIVQAWFAGFFPAEEPKYVAAVLSEDAQTGNQSASPVFAELADALYKPIRYVEK